MSLGEMFGAFSQPRHSGSSGKLRTRNPVTEPDARSKFGSPPASKPEVWPLAFRVR